MKKRNFLLIACCVAVGILAEWLLVDHTFGLNVVLFATLYYCLFYWQMKGKRLMNRKIGFLLMFSILFLALNYFLYWNIVLYLLNLIILPGLIIVHCVLITRKKRVDWNSFGFIGYMFTFTCQWIAFAISRLLVPKKIFASRMQVQSYRTLKMIVLGIFISLPLVFFTGLLLMSADSHFAQLVELLPLQMLDFSIGDELARLAFILIVSLLLYSFVRILRRNHTSYSTQKRDNEVKWEGIIVITVLISLNGLYALFTFVQFQYFFSDTLISGLTYADYARRGFFELIVVTLINWTIVVAVIKTMDMKSKKMNAIINALLSLLVGMSGIMLYSAGMRLTLYEEAYGFTMARILAHAFMVWIGVILTFTFIKIWYKSLSLSRFYIISTLVFYSALNIVDLNRLIVQKNLDRYQETEKLDLFYLQQISAAGTLGLIELYEENPDMPGLKEALIQEKVEAEKNKESWQSSNLVRKQEREALKDLEIR
ncbi:DUF4173 domain-containing protein [Rossellomorea vietnamensis]|uniref:DUF4173 domain-containing protein n=1 Tax=Rossellomorea vietnamensis TaxID=218284 RepID=A0A5D4NYY8_9BACI|nr:DUF4173 domain-containing protein [Rossellomorea vietnamensis]TYS18694.1 DUF4173 domain-containing protein [Rossellomorea vietnamensis]